MKALVTGGGGFLGSNLVKALLARGDTVRTLARGDYPELAKLGVATVKGDITNAAQTLAACEGMDVVFHTAAKAGGWGDPKEYEAINVTGTQNVVDGCKGTGVPVLVHTSSPSVVHGEGDIAGANESIPFAERFLADYPRTKAISEKLAREASDEKLKVVALRPHFIWGPGDRHLLPRLIARASKGKLRRIGADDPKSDTIYIDNCVHAHLLAADRLRAGAPLGGKTYFVSDDQPIGVWTMAERMLAAAGHGPITKIISPGMAWAVASMFETTFRLFGVQSEPLITRFAVSELTHAQWFDISAAKKDLGYAPLVSLDEGLIRLKQSFSK
jgi:nucleoside-diphosphate-sugar epimerase